MSSEEQLISFFAYSMFIYPVTNYLVSPKRKYSRWMGAFYAMGFLVLISCCHVVYENREKGPNHYQLLNVRRDSSISVLKKAYKRLSLELHPDKNKSPTAPSDFNRLKQGYDVLSNSEKRGIYNRLGDDGVKHASQAVVDQKFITIQLLVYYASSAIFAFFMTISEPSGDALSYSLFGLAAMLLLEALVKLEEMALPIWLFPHHTPYEIISMLHRLFPAFMNGCRCIFGSFYEDPIRIRFEALQDVTAFNRAVTLRMSNLITTVLNSISEKNNSIDDENKEKHSEMASKGIVGVALQDVQSRLQENETVDNLPGVKTVLMKSALISDPVLFSKQQEKNERNFIWMRNLALYLLVWFAMNHFRVGKDSASK
eukprot:gene918-1781_t